MRRPRDFDAELKALDDRARQLKARRVDQLGELVIACGADAMPLEQLAGALLAAREQTDTATREAWRQRGAAFFRRPRGARSGAADEPARAAPDGGGAAAARGGAGAA